MQLFKKQRCKKEIIEKYNVSHKSDQDNIKLIKYK